jgi:hypothetical protein
VTRVRIGRCCSGGTGRQLRADITKSGFEMVDCGAHFCGVVGQARRLDASHRGGDDRVDDWLDPPTLHHLRRGLSRACLVCFVLGRRNSGHECGGQCDRQR